MNDQVNNYLNWFVTFHGHGLGREYASIRSVLSVGNQMDDRLQNIVGHIYKQNHFDVHT